MPCRIFILVFFCVERVDDVDTVEVFARDPVDIVGLFLHLFTRGITTTIMMIIIASKAATKPAVITESSQLLPIILIMAHTAIMGDLIII